MANVSASILVKKTSCDIHSKAFDKWRKVAAIRSMISISFLKFHLRTAGQLLLSSLVSIWIALNWASNFCQGIQQLDITTFCKQFWVAVNEFSMGFPCTLFLRSAWQVRFQKTGRISFCWRLYQEAQWFCKNIYAVFQSPRWNLQWADWFIQYFQECKLTGWKLKVSLG